MEVTIRRFIGLSLGAFTLMALARPPRPVGWLYEDYDERSHLSRTRHALTVTQDSVNALDRTIRSLVVRDSSARLLGALPQRAQNQLVADPRMPASLQQHLRAVYADTRQTMPGSAVALPMLVVLDSGSSYFAATSDWLEPALLGTASCATVVRVGVSGRDVTTPAQITRKVIRVLGPDFPRPDAFGLCGFEAAFGEPSAAMHQWLADRDWNAVRVGYTPASPSKGLSMGGRRFPGADMPWWVFGQRDNALQALSVRACRAGQSHWCLAATSPANQLRRDRAGQLPGATLRLPTWWWSFLGAPDLMNAVATSVGAQRFAELWRASDSLPDSYRRLTGVPIDTMVYRVVTAAHAPLTVGATVTSGELLSALLIVALLAGLSTLSHPGRRRP